MYVKAGKRSTMRVVLLRAGALWRATLKVRVPSRMSATEKLTPRYYGVSQVPT
mgnify:CR=1 FL=1